jgi:hypothetical protein
MSEWEEKASRFATLFCTLKCRLKETKRNKKGFTSPCPKRRHAPEENGSPHILLIVAGNPIQMPPQEEGA